MTGNRFFFCWIMAPIQILRSKNGVTALMLLQQSDSDDPEMTLALIKHGARVGDKQPDGSDALYFAKQKGNTPTVALLQKYLQQ